MCGIVGYVSLTAAESPSTIQAMTDRLLHRGPDAGGLFVQPPVFLGHRRLSIVDLSNGQQPCFNEDGSIVIVFNGEIYNHPQLKPHLESLGHRYHSNCDTETILHAYETWGPDCVSHLNGMFAFVLYDTRQRLLFGARDRYGKKPLYYTSAPIASQDGRSQVEFAFASELKAFRAHPAFDQWPVSMPALTDYLLSDYVVGEESIVAGISRLPAGSAFLFGLPDSAQSGWKSWKYWDFSVADESGSVLTPVGNATGRNRIAARNGQPQDSSEPLPQAVRGVWQPLPDAAPPSIEEAGEELLRRLHQAVERRLLSDVPLGLLLSGGIDSSTLLAILAEHRTASQIDTFSIGFDEASFDESGYAEQVAKRFGTRHHCRRFTAAELQRRIPFIAEMLDEPFADPSVLPVSLLCEFARERVTVALTGDGGDELLAGYDPVQAVLPASRYRRFVPSFVHDAVVVPLSHWLPGSSDNMPLQFKVHRFLRGAVADPRIQAATWMGPFSLRQLQRLLPECEQFTDPDAAYAPFWKAYRSVSPAAAQGLAHCIDFFQRFYLTDDILVKADRASMMHSLELRSPFLDTEVAEYVNQLPVSYKYHRGVTKRLLKLALVRPRLRHRTGTTEPLLPAEIVYRRKKGFGIPVARWIRGELRPLFQRTLIDAWPESRLPQFNRWEIERLLQEHLSGRSNHYKELWALFMLALWAEQHLSPEDAWPGAVSMGAVSMGTSKKGSGTTDPVANRRRSAVPNRTSAAREQHPETVLPPVNADVKTSFTTADLSPPKGDQCSHQPAETL